MKPVRTDVGLGDPPKEYTTNDCEASNFMVKYGLHFDKKDPVKFITEVLGIVETQYTFERLAVFSDGPYELADDFIHFGTDPTNISSKESENIITTYLSKGMESARSVQANGGSGLSDITTAAADTGIVAIPMPVLDNMFTEANTLLRQQCVISQPNSGGRNFIVVSGGKNLTITKAARGAGLTCDRQCVHKKSKLCAHTIAVAQYSGTLEFRK